MSPTSHPRSGRAPVVPAPAVLLLNPTPKSASPRHAAGPAVRAPGLPGAPGDLDRPRHLVGISARLVLASKGAAALSVVIGGLVLVGYVARWRWAVQLYPTLPPMYPNAALVFVVGGLAALAAARQRRRARLLAVVGFAGIALYAAITLALHIVEAGPTWLERLWPEHPFVAATTAVAGRPAPETCVAALCIGGAGILLAWRRSPRLMQGLALGTVCVGAAAILGFIIGVDRKSLASTFVVVGMALHTAIALTALGLAVMLAQPTVGLFGRLTRSGPSAQLGRRLVVVVVIAPIALTAASTSILHFSPDARLAQSVVAIAQVLALGLLVMLPLGAAEQVELDANNSLTEARRLTEELGERDAVLAAMTAQLLEVPVAPPGWDLGFRQTVAFATLPGDTCQVLTAPDGRYLLAVVDVAGHGTVAALQALRLRTEIAALWRAGHSLPLVAAAVNASVIELGTIATGLLIGFVEGSGECEYLNAGHPSVVVSHPGSIERWGPTQPLFGIEWASVATEARTLERSAFLIAYTDGVTEARDADRRFLGEGAIEQALRWHAATSPQAIADACVDAALDHSSARLRDDALAIVLQRR